MIHALATVRPYRAHPVAAKCVVLDELEVLLRADQRSRIAGKCDDGKGSEDSVDRAPLESELAKVRPVQKCPRGIEKLPGRSLTASRGSRPGLRWRSPLGGGLLLPFHFEPELVRVHPRHARLL